MRKLVACASAASMVSVVAMIGCADFFGTKDLDAPGDAVGVFHVSAALDPASNCTELVAAAANPWTWDLTLRRDGSTAYWISGGSPLSGTIDSSGNLSFSFSQSVMVHDADAGAQVGVCYVTRADTFTAKLSASEGDAGPQSLSGTLTYQYSVPAGSDCSDIVGAKTADHPNTVYTNMPCFMRYTVTASR
jgi:hypothetical protein